MIVELLQLADRLGMTGQEAFARRPIHWFIDLDEDGNFLGLSPTVARAEKRKGDWSEEVGKEYPCPRYFFIEIAKDGELQAAAGGGRSVAELGAGNTAEIWGRLVSSGKKGQPPKIEDQLPRNRRKARSAFLRMHRRLARECPGCRAAGAVVKYLRRRSFPGDRFRDGTVLRGSLTPQFSFRVDGRPVTSEVALREWWQQQYAIARQAVATKLPMGSGAFSTKQAGLEEGHLTSVFPHIKVPGGGGWCPLASFNKEPFQSYGLGGATLPMRLDDAEKSAAALNWLLRDEASHLRLGDSVAVFWAAQSNGHAGESEAPPFAQLLSEGDPLQVRDFIHGVWGSRPKPLDHQWFHAAILSSPQSRVTVRSWHTDTLPTAVESLRRWLAAASLPDRGGEEGSVSIMDLAACTVRKSKDSSPLPATYIALFEAALFGGRIPSKLLTAALMRQDLELATGCDKKARKEFEARLRARTALIKLYFELTRGAPMTRENHDLERNPAYLCGRLLALLDKIHVDAHRESGGTKSSPASRSYAAASTTPALAFPQLCKLARYHLNKVGGGWANRLEFGYPDQGFEGLAAICARLRETSGQEFPRTLSLEDQGRFAIGFYYERCREWPESKKTGDAGAKARALPDDSAQETSE